MAKPRDMLGRREVVDFPELNLFGVVAKVDTGSYRGTLHCSDFKLVQRGGIKYVKFRPLDPDHPSFKHQPVLFKDYKRAWVRPSSGHNQKRYVIETDIIVKGQAYRIEISLSDRNRMRHPVLIGRKFLKGKFLVDIDKVAGN